MEQHYYKSDTDRVIETLRALIDEVADLKQAVLYTNGLTEAFERWKEATE